MNKTYFAVIYPKSTTTAGGAPRALADPDILKFNGAREVFEFLNSNKSELVAIFEGECVLDWS